jgi:hypothetical protein
VVDETLALGPAIIAPTTSQVGTGAYPRFRFQGTLPAEYDKGASIDGLGSDNIFSLMTTSAYLTSAGSALAYDFTMPDVSGLFGFPAASRLSAGNNDVALGAWGFTASGIFDPRPTLETVFKAVVKVGTISVP